MFTMAEIRAKRMWRTPVSELQADIIELAARTLCQHDGCDPDALQIVAIKDLRSKPVYGDPNWKKYLGSAEAVIYALFPEWKERKL